MQLHQFRAMRTTLDLDDDVLASAKEIARREKKTAGQVLSELARQALTGSVAVTSAARSRRLPEHGFVAFESRGAVVTNEAIDRLRDQGES